MPNRILRISDEGQPVRIVEDGASDPAVFVDSDKSGEKVKIITGRIGEKIRMRDDKRTSREWWSSRKIPITHCIAAYQPINAASLAESYINLVNPLTHTLVPGNAPTWDAATGWDFLKTSTQYLKTDIAPSNNYSVIVRFKDVAASMNNCIFGNFLSTDGYYLLSSYGNLIYNYNFGLELSYTLPSLLKNNSVCLITESLLYEEKLMISTDPPTIKNVTVDVPLYIGARNFNGSAVNHATCKIQAIAFYDISIKEYISELVDAINAL